MSSVKNKTINREFGIQPYRSSKSYQEQMRTATEKARDDLVSGFNPESEMVQPYKQPSYEEMEYNAEAPSGYDIALGLIADMDWQFTPFDSAAFAAYWSDEGYFFTSDGKALMTKDSKFFRANAQALSQGEIISSWISFDFLTQAGEEILPG